MAVEESSDYSSVGKMVVMELTKRAMRSVELLTKNETSDPCLSSNMLLELADFNRLPFGFVFRTELPGRARWLVLRQHAMRALISSAILATDLALGFGLFWMTAWTSEQFVPADLGMLFFMAVLHGATMLFGRTALLCVAFVMLCQPLRKEQREPAMIVGAE